MNKVKFFPLYVVAWLPFPLLYLLSDLAFVIIFYVFRYRRKIVQGNLKRSFPLKHNNEIQRIEKAFYRHFCDMSVESLKSLTISEKQIKKRFRIKNLELLNNFHEDGRSVMLYSSHVGNWEWLASFPLYIDNPASTFYQSQSNQYMNDLLYTMRSRFGAVCIDSKLGFRELIKMNRLEKPALNCLIGDQVPKKNSTVHWTKFLNQETPFFIGPVKIARKFDYAVLYPAFKKTSRGHYEMELILLSEHPKEKTEIDLLEKYVNVLENQIHSAPEMWLWTHKRWKRERNYYKQEFKVELDD